MLLLETVAIYCHLGIFNYHPNVQSVEVRQPVEEPVCEINAPCAANDIIFSNTAVTSIMLIAILECITNVGSQIFPYLYNHMIHRG